MTTGKINLRSARPETLVEAEVAHSLSSSGGLQQDRWQRLVEWRHTGAIEIRHYRSMSDVTGLVTIALAYRTGDRSIRDHFEAADLDFDEPGSVQNAVHDELVTDPRLLPAWQRYSYDERSSPSPYLDGLEVGFFDGRCRDVVRYDDPLDACADFICREASWVLWRARISPESG